MFKPNEENRPLDVVYAAVHRRLKEKTDSVYAQLVEEAGGDKPAEIGEPYDPSPLASALSAFVHTHIIKKLGARPGAPVRTSNSNPDRKIEESAGFLQRTLKSPERLEQLQAEISKMADAVIQEQSEELDRAQSAPRRGGVSGDGQSGRGRG
jgi:hypothetical protein